MPGVQVLLPLPQGLFLGGQPRALLSEGFAEGGVCLQVLLDAGSGVCDGLRRARLSWQHCKCSDVQGWSLWDQARSITQGLDVPWARSRLLRSGNLPPQVLALVACDHHAGAPGPGAREGEQGSDHMPRGGHDGQGRGQVSGQHRERRPHDG